LHSINNLLEGMMKTIDLVADKVIEDRPAGWRGSSFDCAKTHLEKFYSAL